MLEGRAEASNTLATQYKLAEDFGKEFLGNKETTNFLDGIDNSKSQSLSKLQKWKTGLVHEVTRLRHNLVTSSNNNSIISML